MAVANRMNGCKTLNCHREIVQRVVLDNLVVTKVEEYEITFNKISLALPTAGISDKPNDTYICTWQH